MPALSRTHRRLSALTVACFIAATSTLSCVAFAKTCLYTVEKGDTSTSIGSAQGCTAAEIETVNGNVNDFEALEAGRLLILPSTCECPPLPNCTMTLGPGENAYDMATARGCFQEDLEPVNPGVDLDMLPDYFVINLPTDKCRCSDEIIGCGWTVSGDDTIEAIAATLHCGTNAVDNFMEINPALDPDYIVTGQKLLVPPTCDCPPPEKNVPIATDYEYDYEYNDYADAPAPLPVEAPPTPVLAPPPPVIAAPKAPAPPQTNATSTESAVTEDADQQVGDAAAAQNADAQSQSTAGNNDTKWGVIIGAVVAGMLLLNVATIAAVLLIRRRSADGASAAKHDADIDGRSAQAAAKLAIVGGSVDQSSMRGSDAYGTESMPSAARTAPRDNASVQSQSTRSVPESRHPTDGSVLTPTWVDMTWITKEAAVGGTAWGLHRTADTDGINQHSITQSTSTKTATMPWSMGNGSVSSGPSYSDAIEYLQDLLDEFHHTRTLVLNRWAVLSSGERRIGGQGVVQFVWDTHTRQDQVLKLFLNDATFQREAQLYARPNVREMMVAVVHMQEAGTGGISGRVLPSFIVLKKGISLDEWAIKRQPDFATSLQVLMQIVGRLAALHEAGYVHRDLKPANLLWRIDDNDWTIIDFGCVADLQNEGSTAPLAVSLSYAPPEVAHALEAKQESIAVDPSCDMWSLGCVVYELLTQDRIFPRNSSRTTVLAQLTGKVPLPWEPGAPASERARSKRLGLLKRSVLSCLSRDPSQRPTAQALLLTINSLFSSVSTE